MAGNQIKQTTPKVKTKSDITARQFGKFSNKVDTDIQAVKTAQVGRTAAKIDIGSGATVDDVIAALQDAGLMNS